MLPHVADATARGSKTDCPNGLRGWTQAPQRKLRWLKSFAAVWPRRDLLRCAGGIPRLLASRRFLAERPKALTSGASPRGRGLECHSRRPRWRRFDVSSPSEVFPRSFFPARVSNDTLAEWPKALAQRANPRGLGLEPRSCHSLRFVFAHGARCVQSEVNVEPAIPGSVGRCLSGTSLG